MPHCSSRINAYQETTGNDGSKSLVPGMNVKAVEMCMIARSSLATVEVYIDREGMICIDGPHTDAEIPEILAQMPDLVARAQRIRKDVLIAATLRERREADLAWYSLVCFGVPGDIGPGAWHGRGLAERHRLYRMADAAMGTGSCSCARVVRCATEKEARCADISTATNIEYTA